MALDGDLKALERRAYRSMHQDGLWDIMFGLILVGMGLWIFLEDIGMGEVAGLMLFVAITWSGVGAMMAGKRFLTLPRIGMVKFGQARARRIAGVTAMLATSVAFGVVLAVAAGAGYVDFRKSSLILWPTFWFLNALLVFGAMAYLLDFPRLFLLAILFASAFPVFEVLKYNFSSLYNGLVAFAVPGCVIVAVGAVMLYRFLKAYPLPPKEVRDGI